LLNDCIDFSAFPEPAVGDAATLGKLTESRILDLDPAIPLVLAISSCDFPSR
jgi:hypothetical protein